MVKCLVALAGAGDEFTTTVEAGRNPGSPGVGTAGLGIVWVHPEIRFTSFVKPSLTLGRSRECKEQLVSSQMSRRHARVQRAGAIWVLRDEGSRNGTYHNGQRIHEVPLAERDVVRLGDWLGVVATEIDPDHPLRSFPPVPFAGTLMGRALEVARRAAQSRLAILLIGETGTGKEVVARALHAWSGRKGLFVPVNCAALPESLVEAELFGARKGAYTGADRDSEGFFRAADGGTLLLDEVGDLSPRAQAKLLRVLEEGVITPLGAAHGIAVDVRVVAAAQTQLIDKVQTNQFRADLYSRLRGVELRLPCLRERREEIVPLLFAQLREQLGGRVPSIQVELLERCALYDWPLNVRELVQVARRLAVLHGHEPTLAEGCLPEHMLGWASGELRTPSSEPTRSQSRPARKGQAQDHREQQLRGLLEALHKHEGNVSKAASAIGIARRQAYRLLDLRPDLNLARFRNPYR